MPLSVQRPGMPGRRQRDRPTAGVAGTPHSVHPADRLHRRPPDASPTPWDLTVLGSRPQMKVLLDLASADSGHASIAGTRYRDLPDHRTNRRRRARAQRVPPRTQRPQPPAHPSPTALGPPCSRRRAARDGGAAPRRGPPRPGYSTRRGPRPESATSAPALWSRPGSRWPTWPTTWPTPAPRPPWSRPAWSRCSTSWA